MLQNIQQEWLEKGDAHVIEEYFETHLLERSKYISDILVLENEETVLAVKKTGDYEFEEIQGVDYIYFCKDKDNNNKYHLAISSAPENNIRYILILDLEKFYNATANEKKQLHDGVIYISIDKSFAIYSLHGKQYAGPVNDIQEIHQENECVKALLNASADKQDGLIAYEDYNPKTGKKENKFVISVPGEKNQNGLFTVGVMLSFGETINSIQKATFFALLSGSMIMLGSICLFYVVNNGIKENKRREKELQEEAHRQRLETIGVLTSGIAHEFNNLLTPIMGYSMMTLEKLPEENEEICDNIIEIYNASRKAKDVINRLSELSRKKDTITYQKIGVDDVIEKALNIVKASQPKLVSVEKAMNCKNIVISANETLIMQMVMNLVLNSYQMLEESGGVVEVSTWIENDHVVISVGDTGPGIPEENMEKIFEPFFTTKHTAKGTGLGLSIVNQVVDAHQGEIRVRNKEEGGCIFVIYLPIDE